MQALGHKIGVTVLFMLLTLATWGDQRETFLSHGPSVAAFGRGEASVVTFDDVSSIFYNPALNADLTRTTFSLAYYQLLEGSMYSYGGFGMPLGQNLSASFHVINVRSGDVELRTNINDTPSITQTSQSAFILSAARSHISPLDFQAGLDIRCVTMNLDGFSGSGVGLDGGLSKNFVGPILFGNRSHIDLGLSVQNIVSPDIKLISEDELYPALTRIGAAITMPTLYRTFSNDELMLAADLVSEDNVVRPSVGLQYSFVKQYIIRCGYYPDHATIGAGYRVANFHIDYGFDLGDYFNINRFSISYFFATAAKGKKYSLMKEAKQSLAEAEKEQRLRQQEAKKLIDLGITYYDRKYYLKATDVFREVMIKYPEYETAQIYNKKISDEMNETIETTNPDIEKFGYASGYVAYQKPSYTDALNEWEKVIQINPQRQELIEYISKTKTYLRDAERLAIEKKLREKVHQLFTDGASAYDSSRWISCIKSMEQIQTICKENQFPESFEFSVKSANYIKKCVEKLTESIRAPKETTVTAEAEVDEQGAEKHYQEGLVFYAQGKQFDAEKSWELALRLDPNHLKAQKALKKMKEGK